MIAAGASIDEQRATATFYADHPDSFNARVQALAVTDEVHHL